MMVRGKAIVLGAVVAAVVGGRKQWLDICHREKLIARVMAVAMLTIATVIILVMEVGLVMVNPQL